ncbi:hypothetical protein BGZ60DRAFT_428962 [Tricladium varicosporioides]|nr:hypothetical protein BGZ60DRAFT_428962 [Hymenoscyphus varicosporioides]
MVKTKSGLKASTRHNFRQRHTTIKPTQAHRKLPKSIKEKRECMHEPTFKFFTRLPTELRLRIWHLAIPEARIIHLRVHTLTKTPYVGPLLPLGKIKGVSFTASLPPTNMPLEFRQLYPAYVYSDPQTDWHALHPDNAVSPLGPSLLYVCSESREVALQYYALEFGGMHWMDGNRQFKERWERYELGEKKIWVDFKRDVVFLEFIHIFNIQNFMQILSYFMKDGNGGSLGRIRRLGIGGAWPLGEGDRYSEIMRVLEEPSFASTFSTVEELLIWDACYIGETASATPGPDNRFGKKDVIEEVRQRLEENVRRSLGDKEEKGWWGKDRLIPVVRIMRDEDRIGMLLNRPTRKM